MFRALHEAAAHDDATTRDGWQPFDASEELDRAAKQPRDTVLCDVHGAPMLGPRGELQLKPIRRLVHDRLLAQPFPLLAEFDVEHFVDYGARLLRQQRVGRQRATVPARGTQQRPAREAAREGREGRTRGGEALEVIRREGPHSLGRWRRRGSKRWHVPSLAPSRRPALAVAPSARLPLLLVPIVLLTSTYQVPADGVGVLLRFWLTPRPRNPGCTSTCFGIDSVDWSTKRQLEARVRFPDARRDQP